MKAAILLGGRGRRMGGVYKGSIRAADGLTLVERLSGLLTRCVGQTCGITRQGETSPCESTLFDALPDAGPLSGLRTALAWGGDDWVFVSAVDLPNLDAAFVDSLRIALEDDLDVVLAEVQGRPHPLAAFWHPRALPVVDAALSAGRYRVTSVLSELRTRRLTEGFDPHALLNVNSLDDLAEAGLRLP